LTALNFATDLECSLHSEAKLLVEPMLNSIHGSTMLELRAELPGFVAGLARATVFSLAAQDGWLTNPLAAPLEEWPIQSNIADGLLLNFVLEAQVRPSLVLAQALRVLKPGGVLLITGFNARGWRRFPNKQLSEAERDFVRRIAAQPGIATTPLSPRRIARELVPMGADTMRLEYFSPAYSFGAGATRLLGQATQAFLPSFGWGYVLLCVKRGPMFIHGRTLGSKRQAMIGAQVARRSTATRLETP
jgi:SAM-dependent methyltransferase